MSEKPLHSHLVHAAFEASNRHAIRLFALTGSRVPGSNRILLHLFSAQIIEEALAFAVNCRRLCEWFDIKKIQIKHSEDADKAPPMTLGKALDFLIHSRTCKVIFLDTTHPPKTFVDDPQNDKFAAYLSGETDREPDVKIPVRSMVWTYFTDVAPRMPNAKN